jgi:hypothetical protein
MQSIGEIIMDNTDNFVKSIVPYGSNYKDAYTNNDIVSINIQCKDKKYRLFRYDINKPIEYIRNKIRDFIESED